MTSRSRRASQPVTTISGSWKAEASITGRSLYHVPGWMGVARRRLKSGTLRHRARDWRNQRLHVARSAAHLRLLADHEGRVAPIRSRVPRPSRPAHGDAVCPSLAGVPVCGSWAIGSSDADIAAASRRSDVTRKGKKRATGFDARTDAGESRQIFDVKSQDTVDASGSLSVWWALFEQRMSAVGGGNCCVVSKA
jgi:hypothetical protein